MLHHVHVDGINGSTGLRQLLMCENVLRHVTLWKVSLPHQIKQPSLNFLTMRLMLNGPFREVVGFWSWNIIRMVFIVWVIVLWRCSVLMYL